MHIDMKNSNIMNFEVLIYNNVFVFMIDKTPSSMKKLPMYKPNQLA